MKQYKNFISLGYFCSVALELEKIGLRSTSSPFDWVISNYEGVINAIQNHFEDFLSYDHLLQSESIRKRYFDEKYRMWFFHDFDQYHSLKAQLPDVKAKYLRRIDRFYEDIKQPTLFVRYISDETEEELDVVARQFLDKNDELRQIFESIKYPLRQKNLEFYNQKQKKKQNIFFEMKQIVSAASKKILPEYRHDRVCYDMVK